MKKSSGVRLQELPFFPILQYTKKGALLNFYLFSSIVSIGIVSLPPSRQHPPPFFLLSIFQCWCFCLRRLFSSFLTSLSLCSPLSLSLSPHLSLFFSSGIACLIFYLCGGAAGWIRAWTGPTNHPDLQDSFSITSPVLFHLYKYKHRERDAAQEGKKWK